MTGRGARRAWIAAIALVSVVAAPWAAHARPRRPGARAAFDRGVAAYQKGSYAAASEALGKSFELERDVDTLFAWAQAERRLDHCDKAIELYELLLTFNLPAANKTAVEQKLTECRVPAPGDAAPAAPATPAAATPAAPPPPEPEPAPVAIATLDSLPPPAAVEPPRTALPPAPEPIDPGPRSRAWYADPVALTLLGAGAIAGGVGVGFMVSARSASDAAQTASSYPETLDLRDKARQRGMIGAVSAISGGVLVVGGVVWILTRSGHTEDRAVAGWLAPGGGGLALGGRF